jgi:hypothetical protein
MCPASCQRAWLDVAPDAYQIRRLRLYCLADRQNSCGREATIHTRAGTVIDVTSPKESAG